jgi:hypothetical protein
MSLSVAIILFCLVGLLGIWLEDRRRLRTPTWLKEEGERLERERLEREGR